MYRLLRSVRKKVSCYQYNQPFEIEDDIFAMVSGCRVYTKNSTPPRMNPGSPRSNGGPNGFATAQPTTSLTDQECFVIRQSTFWFPNQITCPSSFRVAEMGLTGATETATAFCFLRHGDAR